MYISQLTNVTVHTFELSAPSLWFLISRVQSMMAWKAVPSIPKGELRFAPSLRGVLHCSVKLGTKRGKGPLREGCEWKLVCGVGPLLHEFCQSSKKMNWSTYTRHAIVELYPRKFTSIITCESDQPRDSCGKPAMEDDLPTEYDVVVVGTGIDFYQNEIESRVAFVKWMNFSSVIPFAVMILDRYDRIHRRRGGKQDWQEGSAFG